MPTPDPKPTLFPKDLWTTLWTIADRTNAAPIHKTLGKPGPDYIDHCNINPDDVSFPEDSPSELVAGLQWTGALTYWHAQGCPSDI